MNKAIEWQTRICESILTCLEDDASDIDEVLGVDAGLVFAALNGALLMSHKIREENEDGSSSAGASSEAGSDSSHMSGAMSEDQGVAIDPDDDDGNDDEIQPEEDVQICLASLGTDRLIRAFLSPGAPEKVGFRAIRLGVLLLQGGNETVQDAFKALVIADKQQHLKSTFFDNIRRKLRTAILSAEPQTAQRDGM